jgi:hypothetical protein
MKTHGGVDVYTHVFLTSALGEVSGQLHAPATLPHGKSLHYTYWIGGWVGPSNGLDNEETIRGPAKTRTPPPRSSSL